MSIVVVSLETFIKEADRHLYKSFLILCVLIFVFLQASGARKRIAYLREYYCPFSQLVHLTSTVR